MQQVAGEGLKQGLFRIPFSRSFVLPQGTDFASQVLDSENPRYGPCHFNICNSPEDNQMI